MKYCLAASLIMLSGIMLTISAQTSDTNYERPLRKVLIEIEQRFDVTLNWKEEMVEGKVLDYAFWRLRPDVEESLENVLSPVNMSFQKQGDGQYKIKAFEYHRRPVEEGKAFLEYLKTLYDDKSEWEQRKAQLRSCFLDALGLSEMPEWPDTEPLFSNPRTYDGYTVVNVALETFPGVYVTGSLYKPEEIKGKIPVIVSPNGHFQEGRYNKDMQIRYAMLARMGAMVMSYDLFAWGESGLQFDPDTHRKSLAMTMQYINGQRVLDFLLSQKQADPERVGITGGSGGGSQTMLQAAIDDRFTVSVPVVMLSSYFYGGCPCESGRPVHLCGNGTNNVEMASMMAPKPMLVVSDGGDWTAHVTEIEFPFLQRTWGFYGKTENVKNIHIPDEGHSYGPNKRFPMYSFMATHLGMKNLARDDGTWNESSCVVEEKEDMYVFDNNPENLPDGAIRSFTELDKVFSNL